MTDQRPYHDRHEAGKILAERIPETIRHSDALVLALPRGGVPVGFEVAQALHASLDVFIVRKLGAPDQPELAIGAIASGGYEILNQALVAQLGITQMEIAEIADRELHELHRREHLYRDDRPPANVQGRTVLLTDDGLATGFTMRAAIMAVRDQGAAHLIVAVPVGAPDTCEDLSQLVDEVICPLQPDPFHAVGLWYEKFQQTTDDEVREYLTASHAHAGRH